jgi:hypothetical protein
MQHWQAIIQRVINIIEDMDKIAVLLGGVPDLFETTVTIIKNDVNMMLNVVFKEEYDWFQSIQINEIGGARQAIVVGVMTVDPTWLNKQYQEVHHSTTIPDLIDFGDIVSSEYHSEFVDTINNVISAMAGKNLNIVTSFLDVKFGEESED